MKKISKISAIFLTITSLACILWMGSYLLRMFLTYQLFDETLSTYKSYINEQNINGILITLNPSVITPFILYIIFIVFFILFLLTSKLSLKQNGWLFIIMILVLVTFPFEIYLMTIDYKIFTLVSKGIFQSSEITALIIRRFKDLSSFPLIELLCYCAVVFLAIFKPMTLEKISS
jgi:hypothetical protein